jgi:sialate O-acetylesterase
MTVAAGVATIRFLNADNGLTSYNKPLDILKLRVRIKAFHPATAVISGSTVLVSSPLVKEPVAVRYAFP